ncbi:MAG: hypothetical protein AAFO57_05350 [Pseudomonadota bacterium]
MTFRLTLLGASAIALAGPAFADSLGNASEASADSAEAGLRLVASGGQIALGAVAIPLAASGAIAEGTGQAASDISDELWETANSPLKVDDRVVLAQPAPNVPRVSSEEAER